MKHAEVTHWAVKVNEKYYSLTSKDRIQYVSNIQNANRFINLKGAEFMAKRLGGEVVECTVVNGNVKEKEAEE